MSEIDNSIGRKKANSRQRKIRASILMLFLLLVLFFCLMRNTNFIHSVNDDVREYYTEYVQYFRTEMQTAPTIDEW